MGHVKGDTIRVYLPAESAERLDMLKKAGKIKNVAAFFREKLIEEATKFDPETELKKIEEEQKRLDERKKVWLQCVHTQGSRFKELGLFLDKYRAYQKSRPSPEQTKNWLGGRQDELKEFFSGLALADTSQRLDQLIRVPNLTKDEAEKVIGGPL